MIGVATSRAGAARLSPWLKDAAQAGADVALICPPDTEHGAMGRRRFLEGGGIGALLRALDAEDQVRPIDALVSAGRRERIMLRAAPRALRGAIPPIPAEEAPADAVRRVDERARSEAT